jgi:translation initiation factor 4E
MRSLEMPDRLIRSGDAESQLSRPYSLWFLRRYEGVEYEDGLFCVGSFDTVEQFWKFYSHMKRPDELDGNIEFHLFERGVRPLWEDEQNVRGGKWVMTLRKGHASSFWEDLVFGIVGGSFDPEFVTGAVLSIRKNKDVLALWTGDGTDLERRESTRLKFVELLQLPDDVIMEYSLHNEALSKLQTTGIGETPAP